METLHEHEPSTSASTVRGLRHFDMALLSDSYATQSQDEPLDSHSPFHPSSPHSAFQSEPGSPSGDSVSSFPSVGSSFLFSSGPVTPPHPGHHPEVDDEGELGDSTSGLVIPSLTLPSPSKRPTAYGQTIGDLRLLFLGPKGADMAAITTQIVDDNEDVVEVGLWEDVREDTGTARGKWKALLHVSTYWVEHRDRHGLEHVEPARNVEIVELPPYDPYSEIDNVSDRILPVIHSPFREVFDMLSPDHPPSGTLAHLLSSSCSPLYVALILLTTPSLTPVETALIESLSPHIPIILLPSSLAPLTVPVPPPRDRSRRASTSHLSSFRPSSLDALRLGLFRTPSTLANLRMEAASRFLRWREVERAVERVQWSAGATKTPVVQDARPSITRSSETVRNIKWDKEAWEAQWEGSLSQEVALHLRRRRRRSDPAQRISPLSSLSTLGRHSTSITATLDSSEDADDETTAPAPCINPSFDPLHLPSLVVFSFSLLGALRSRIGRSVGWQTTEPRGSPAAQTSAKRGRQERPGARRSFGYRFGLGLALVSAFCAGVGIGLVATTRF
ncbi:hypothetical protein C8Q80DRAFT_1096149 [Daedaleopsis nitida]|nr:hypothetical protein C8Q80DRAFT_1096149 [Daedaleopsis nitida]